METLRGARTADAWRAVVAGQADASRGTVMNVSDLPGRMIGANGVLVALQPGSLYAVVPDAAAFTNSENEPDWSGCASSSSPPPTGSAGLGPRPPKQGGSLLRPLAGPALPVPRWSFYRPSLRG